MGACLTKIKSSEKQSVNKIFQELNTSLENIQVLLKKILEKNSEVNSEVNENQVPYICKKNEEATLSNRDQIDYLLQNCVNFGKRLKELENKSIKQLENKSINKI